MLIRQTVGWQSERQRLAAPRDAPECPGWCLGFSCGAPLSSNHIRVCLEPVCSPRRRRHGRVQGARSSRCKCPTQQLDKTTHRSTPQGPRGIIASLYLWLLLCSLSVSRPAPRPTVLLLPGVRPRSPLPHSLISFLDLPFFFFFCHFFSSYHLAPSAAPVLPVSPLLIYRPSLSSASCSSNSSSLFTATAMIPPPLPHPHSPPRHFLPH